MKNNKMMAIAALALAGLLALAGCGSNGNSAKTGAKSQATEQKADDKADDKGGDKGFEEVPVGPHQDQNIGPLTIGAVYFQPRLVGSEMCIRDRLSIRQAANPLARVLLCR